MAISRRIRRFRSLLVSGSLAAALAFAPQPSMGKVKIALPRAQSSPKKKPREPVGLFELLTGVASIPGSPDETPSGATLRRLGQLEHPRARARLLEVGENEQALEHPRARLEWVRAVARHLERMKDEGPRAREPLVIALIPVLLTDPALMAGSKAQDETAQNETAPEQPGRPLQLAKWAQSSAAHALARDGHPRAMRVLFAQATTSGARREVAREALCASPPSPNVLRKKLGNELISSTRLEEALACTTKPPSKKDEARLSRGPRSLPQLRSERAKTRFLRFLAELAQRDRLPEAWQRPGLWSRLVAEHEGGARADALRTLAIVTYFAAPSRRDSLLETARTLARRHVAASDDATRAAAAWLWAVVEPSAARPLLSADDQVVRYAALRQAWHGPLARKWAALHPSSPGPALAAPDVWSRYSTATLRQFAKDQHERKLGTLWVGPLVARFVEDPVGGPAPPVAEAQSLLSHPDPDMRASAAIGLGEVARRQTALAAGLLRTAYDTETASAVRAAICKSLTKLSRRPSHELEPSFRPLAALDSLPPCRSLASARRTAENPSSSSEVHIGSSQKPVFWAPRDAGPPVPLHPDPDGFVATLGPSIE